MDHYIILYYLITLLIGLGAGALSVMSFLLHRNPLSLRFLIVYLIFSLFYASVGANAYLVRYSGVDALMHEQLAQTVFFFYYALLTPYWSAFVLELLQKPFRGAWRWFSLGFSATGALLPLYAHFFITDFYSRVLFLRFSLNGVYLFVFIGFLAWISIWSAFKVGGLQDPWKKKTLFLNNWLLLGAVPLFVFDGLWPWFQLQYNWVPRAFNFHGLFYVLFNLFYAWRWYLRLRSREDGGDQVPPAPATVSAERLHNFNLTERERDIVVRIFEGHSNQGIADALTISLGTVKNHIYNIFQKTGASSRRELRWILS